MAWNAKQTNGYDLANPTDEALAQENAQLMRIVFENAGFTNFNGVCAMAGAMQAECDFNPWLWEGNDIQTTYDIDINVGYGLVQFTPSTEYIGVANNSSQHPYSAPYYSPNFLNSSGSTSDGESQCQFLAKYHMGSSDGWLNMNKQRWVNVFNQIDPSINIDTAYAMSFNDFKTGNYSLQDCIIAIIINYLRPADSSVIQNYTNRYLNFTNYYYTYFSGSPAPTVFVPRFSLEHPAPSPWYTPPDNWYAANGYAPDYGITYPNGNCTWYAYGRYAEIRNGFANLSHRNAGYWYEDATAFQRGDFSLGAEPRLGAIVCFKDAVDPDTYVGHLTVVEQINNDGTIVVSQSGYSTGGGNTYFWTSTVSRDNQYRESWYTQGGRNYYCQGFIYNDVSPIPPVPPVPSLSTKMPLWMMCLRKIH